MTKFSGFQKIFLPEFLRELAIFPITSHMRKPNCPQKKSLKKKTNTLKSLKILINTKKTRWVS